MRKILTLTISRSYFWSDSTATLLSIYSTKKKFPVFMANRLAEIEETTSKADWKYVPTNVSPADDISKSLVIKSFVQRSKWLTGLEFLKQSPLDEPQAPESVQMVQHRLQSNQVRTINALPVVFSGTDDSLPTDKLITHYSSLHKLKIAALWLLHFGKFLLAKVRQCTNEINANLDRITVNEADKIEKLLIRYEQRRMYPKLYHVMDCNKQLNDDVCPKSIRRYSPILINGLIRVKGRLNHRRDGVVVRASASQSVDLGFIPLVESYQKTLKNGIHSFPAWRSAFRGGYGEQAGKFACCVLGQGT